MSETPSSDPARLTRRRFLGAALGAAAAPRAAWAAAAKAPAAEVPADGMAAPPLETIVLSRLAFGVSAADLADLRALGAAPRARLEAWLERQLRPETIDDADCERRLAGFKTLGKSLTQLWSEYMVEYQKLHEMAPGQTRPGARMIGDTYAPPKKTDATGGMSELAPMRPVQELEAAAWLRAAFSRRQLNEVLVGFWHDHFNVYGWESLAAPVFVSYDRDVIRPRALGNFRDLLEAVAKSPSMLHYLDNALSASSNPNENYARELLELHTLGAENYLGTRARSKVPRGKDGLPVGYVDGDVYEAARAFTGWRVADGQGVANTGEFLYFEAWHDRFQKVVLGREIPELQPALKDGLDVLDALADHPGTARHVSGKLCRRLVGDDPPPRLLAEAAKVFHEERRAPDQIARVVRTIALSPEFRATWGRKMRRPFEAAVAMLRATGAELAPGDAFLSEQARGGQRLFQCATPDGYPDERARWGSTTSMLERWRQANVLTDEGWKGVRADVAAATPTTLKTPRALARFWRERTLGWEGSAAHSAVVRDFLAQGRDPDAPLPKDLRRERLPGAVALALMAPEFHLQ